ncbi:plasmid mobilization protein [Pseudochrobactrum sp. HB0163]
MPDYIRIRVFPEEKQHLKEVAQKRGISFSELIRSKTLPVKGCEVAA